MCSGKELTKFKHQASGFAYIFLLVTIAVIGAIAASSLQIGTQITRREAEQALQVVGMEFEQALYSYANATPISNGLNSNSVAKGPRTFDELLKDTRFASVKRHLRQLQADPLTGLNQWGVVTDNTGFILGIYSLAPGKPIQQTGFVNAHSNFENSINYESWVFGLPSVYSPENQSTQINW
jgi:type II secretory pathway pseudopilin PulG